MSCGRTRAGRRKGHRGRQRFVEETTRTTPDLNTEYHRELVRSLDLALVPGEGKPGTVGALIDALVDYHSDAGTLGLFEPGDRFWRIAELGFEAVPALLGHLSDDRLTPAKMIGFNNFRPWNLRVGDVVGDLLDGLAAEELERGADGDNSGGGWRRRQQGYGVNKAAATAWWEKARKVGEETYLLDRVLPPPAAWAEKEFVNSHLLQIITAKYPKHLPALYRRVLEKRSDLQSWELAATIARGPFPAREKLDLFLAASRHRDPAHRLPALSALQDLDRKQFDARLIQTIDGFPKDVSAA
jgi:hypothetical protein